MLKHANARCNRKKETTDGKSKFPDEAERMSSSSRRPGKKEKGAGAELNKNLD